MDKRIALLIDKALAGGELMEAELRTLFAIDYLSEESFAVQFASRKMSAEASNGLAEVHAQVGINAGPCSGECQFCSFAASNKIFHAMTVTPLENLMQQCVGFEADGANAIYLMSTAAYRLSDLLQVAREVKAALKPETPLIANFRDFDDDEALALVEAGITGVYHAIRLGEGIVTRFDPQARLKTVQAAHKAGLLIGTCLEPVGPEHSLDELVEKTALTRAIGAVYSGAGRRITIPGSPLGAYGMVNYGRMALIVAAVRLFMGYGVPGNCTHEPNELGAFAGANLFWAEAGSNPRDTHQETQRGWTVQQAREAFMEAGWGVLDGPSVLFRR